MLIIFCFGPIAAVAFYLAFTQVPTKMKIPARKLTTQSI